MTRHIGCWYFTIDFPRRFCFIQRAILAVEVFNFKHLWDIFEFIANMLRYQSQHQTFSWEKSDDHRSGEATKNICWQQNGSEVVTQQTGPYSSGRTFYKEFCTGRKSHDVAEKEPEGKCKRSFYSFPGKHFTHDIRHHSNDPITTDENPVKANSKANTHLKKSSAYLRHTSKQLPVVREKITVSVNENDGLLQNQGTEELLNSKLDVEMLERDKQVRTSTCYRRIFL